MQKIRNSSALAVELRLFYISIIVLFQLFGHTRVSVLEGGIKAWTDAGYPTAAGEETAPVST